MQDQAFREWLVYKSWMQGVRYSKVVACLLPLGALAIHARFLGSGWQAFPASSVWLLAWHVVAELFFIAIILLDRWVPRLRGKEWALNAACASAVALATWLSIVDGRLRADLSIYAAGLTFVAAVMCTPRPVRRPMYVLSFLVLGMAVGWRAGGGAEALALLVNPFCVVVLCIELDKFTYARNMELYAQTQLAESERARADRVLYNVFPAHIAEELKRSDKVSAVKFDNMGVLFADLAGFTSFSRALPPNALVLVLNEIFSSFDDLVERHQLEKIKTIGDAYMVVSYDQLLGLGQLALDMGEAVQNYNRTTGTKLGMRIGIHVGPAVAGVIGVKRFLYDVWGDTVNVASRMEASGEPGAIHVTEAVYLQTRNSFEFSAREPIELKDRGRMSTYWLLGRTGHSAGLPPGVPVSPQA